MKWDIYYKPDIECCQKPLQTSWESSEAQDEDLSST